MLNTRRDYITTISDPVQQSFIRDLLDRETADQEQVIRYREYYDGLHTTQLTERARQYLRVKRDAEFNANYCPMVVNAKANRLSVSAIDTDDNQKEILWGWWRKNKMDRKQGIVHRNTIRDGNAYVLVEWDNAAQIPRFYYEPTFAGDGVKAFYSEEHREDIEFVSKTWQLKYGAGTGKVTRKNLYFPDRIEKYIAHSDISFGNWRPYQDDETEVRAGRLGMAGVVWWTDNRQENGSALGIPIVHFKHNDNGDCYGSSHLRDILPLQDALNKTLIDLLAMMDVAGFGLLVGYGNTNWGSVKVAPGAVASVPTKPDEAKLERLPGDNPTPVLSVYNGLVMEIARISGTPLSYFQVSGQVAAEGTMKQQEIALVSQIKKAQIDFGNSWEECFTIARRLHNAFNQTRGAPKLDEGVVIDTIWHEAESRNDKEQAETLTLKVTNLGVSEEQAQIEMGYNETEIIDMKRAALREQANRIRNMLSMQSGLQANNSAQSSAQMMTQTENQGQNNNGSQNSAGGNASRNNTGTTQTNNPAA